MGRPSDSASAEPFFLWDEEEVLARGAELRESEDSALIVGETRQVLDALPADLCQTCVTSPPYWFVRNYGVEGQLGLEVELDDYIYNLVETFTHVHRVMRPDGVLWLNIGDGYTSGGRTWRAPDKKNPNRAMGDRPPTPPGLKPKDLLGVPWRLAFALQQPWLRCKGCGAEHHSMRWGRMPDGAAICPSCQTVTETEESRPGWFLRSELIWYRPNCQPESVGDRVTRSHEHLFMFSKSKTYFYDNKSRRGPNDRNLRTVWSINTKPGKHGHIAPFPEALVDPCVARTSRPGDVVLDPFVGSGTTALVAQGLERRFVGVELFDQYARVAEARLRDAATSPRLIAPDELLVEPL